MAYKFFCAHGRKDKEDPECGCGNRFGSVDFAGVRGMGPLIQREDIKNRMPHYKASGQTTPYHETYTFSSKSKTEVPRQATQSRSLPVLASFTMP